MAWPSNSIRTKDWGSEILTDATLEAQLDILHQYFIDSFNGTSGHGHTGSTNDGRKIDLTAAVTGTLPLGNGGTGQTTLAGLMNLIYPVGSIYANYSNSTNPGTLLGFGTWVALSAFLAGIDGSTEFLTPGQTGGAKTHTHTYSGNTDGPTFGGSTGSNTAGALDTKHYHAYSGTTASGSSLPPYTAVYIWRRTA